MVILAMLAIVWLVVTAEKLVYRNFWSKGLSLDIKLQEDAKDSAAVTVLEAEEDQRIVLNVSVSNAKVLALPWVETKLQLSRGLWIQGEASLSDYYYQTDLFSVGAYKRVTRRFKMVCGRRGYYAVRGATLSSRNLLATERNIKKTDSRCFLTVFPKQVDTDRLEVLYNSLQGTAAVRRFTNPDPFEFRGIRDYRSTDSLRLINHRATAKTGELMVNILSPTMTRRVDLLLNLEMYSSWSRTEIFEESIRIAASLAEEFTADGFSVALRTNGRDAVFETEQTVSEGTGSRHGYSIAEALARINLKLPADDFSLRLADITDTDSVYILISANWSREIEAEYRRLMETGACVFWVMPVMQGDAAKVPEDLGMIFWEVSPDEPMAEAA